MTGTAIERSNGAPVVAPHEAQLSDTEIKQRIELSAKGRFGLENANPLQLNIAYIYAKRYGLDPISDITYLYGKPEPTIEGWMRVIRRHPNFWKIDTRPLRKDEKADWGYAEDDLVVECAIETHANGTVRARGRVMRSEVDDALGRSRQSGKRAAPIATYDVEMAEKRAIARCARLAFGKVLPSDEDLERMMIEEMERRNDPERTRALSDRYAEIFPGDDDEPYVPTRERDVDDAQRGQEIVERAHTAARQRDEDLDQLEAERQRAREGLL